jgi:cell division protein ZapA (FtsZ GTPase activity inhibitor)
MSDTIKIDDKTYNIADLSDDAKTQINNLQAVDQQIQRLQQQAAIAQTARMAYVASLQSLLPEATVAS